MENFTKKSNSGGHHSKNRSELGLHNLTKKLKRKQDNSLIKKMKNLGKDGAHLPKEIMKELVCPITIETAVANKSKKKKEKKNKKNVETNEPEVPGSKPLLNNYFGSSNACDHNSDDSDACDVDLFPTRKTLRPENCEIKHGPLMYNPELLPIVTPSFQRERSNGVVEYHNETVVSGRHARVPQPLQPVRFYDIPKEKFLVVLKHPTTLYFQGQLNVKVVFGSLEILGCTVTRATQKSVAVFSAGRTSMLGLHALMHDDNQDEVENSLHKLGVNSKLSQLLVEDLCNEHCLVVIDKVHSTLSDFLASRCSIYLYPQNIRPDRQYYEQENKLQCRFQTRKDLLSWSYTQPHAWDDLANKIGLETCESQRSNCTGPRVMVCGGKAVGKSTLLHFLVNKSLSDVDDVLYLDFDPGQSEFTVPGCVSVVRVSEPLLGPNFTHIMDTERTVFVGDVSVSKCPDRYIQSAQHIIDYCHSRAEYKNMVWFINTMGFSKGIGVELTASLIKMVKPTHVVQIQSRLPRRNFRDLLTPDNIVQHKNWWSTASATEGSPLNYEHVVLESAAEKEDEAHEVLWGYQAKVSRNLVVLAYINKMLEPPKYSLTDIVPFKVPLARLKLSICHESLHYSQYLNVMNGNLVALCTVDEYDEKILKPNDPTLPSVLAQPPIAPCLGFGIVRGVDITERMLYLLTPLTEQELGSINCLAMGSEMLPEVVYMAAAAGDGHLPYVAMGPGQVTSKGVKRQFNPRMRK